MDVLLSGPKVFRTRRRGIPKSFCYPCSPRQLKAALQEQDAQGKPVFWWLEFEAAYDKALVKRLPGTLVAVGEAYLLRGEPELKETTPQLMPWLRLHAVRREEWSPALTEAFLMQALPGMLHWLEEELKLPETGRTGRHEIAAVLEGRQIVLYTIRSTLGATSGASFEINRYVRRPEGSPP